MVYNSSKYHWVVQQTIHHPDVEEKVGLLSGLTVYNYYEGHPIKNETFSIAQ